MLHSVEWKIRAACTTRRAKGPRRRRRGVLHSCIIITHTHTSTTPAAAQQCECVVCVRVAWSAHNQQTSHNHKRTHNARTHEMCASSANNALARAPQSTVFDGLIDGGNYCEMRAPRAWPTRHAKQQPKHRRCESTRTHLSAAASGRHAVARP